MPSTLCRLLAAASIALALTPLSARADVPFQRVFLTNGVEVDGQDKFADWVVIVFPGGPPSGRPIAWPALVEPGFQTAIDRQTLGAEAVVAAKRGGEAVPAARRSFDPSECDHDLLRLPPEPLE